MIYAFKLVAHVARITDRSRSARPCSILGCAAAVFVACIVGASSLAAATVKESEIRGALKSIAALRERGKAYADETEAATMANLLREGQEGGVRGLYWLDRAAQAEGLSDL